MLEFEMGKKEKEDRKPHPLSSQYIDRVSHELNTDFVLIDVGTPATMRNSFLASSLSTVIFLLLIPEGKTDSCHFPYNHESKPSRLSLNF